MAALLFGKLSNVVWSAKPATVDLSVVKDKVVKARNCSLHDILHLANALSKVIPHVISASMSMMLALISLCLDAPPMMSAIVTCS